MTTAYRFVLLSVCIALLVSGCARPPRPRAVAGATAATTMEMEQDEEAVIQANLAKLSPTDRALAQAQGCCAVEPENRLGCMGVPAKITIKGQPVFLCCAGCETAARKDEAKTLTVVAELREKLLEVANERAIQASLDKLSAEDREEAESQRFCPIEREHRLGTVGPPIKIKLKGEDVFLCCGDCREEAEKNADKTLATVLELHIDTSLSKLSEEDRKLARQQRFCAAFPDNRLGSMGVPPKLMVKGRPVFICCAGCAKTVQADADKTLKIVDELTRKNAVTATKK